MSEEPITNVNDVDETEVESVIPFIATLGKCNVPSYFATDIETVKACNDGMASGLFKAALLMNTVFSIIFYKEVSPGYVIGFILFHIFLYYFIHKILVEISVGEWKTFQAYKDAVKRDPDHNKLDTPLTQFRSITTFLLDQPINKQKMIYLILIVSFVFVWLPLLIHIGDQNHRFDLSVIRRYLTGKM